MSHISNDEIRGVVLQCAGERVLLPNATVAEVMSRVNLLPVSGQRPHWWAGGLAWQGFDLPVVALGRYAGLDEQVTDGPQKVVVLKGLSNAAALPYYAMLTESFPQLIAIPRDGLLADASEDELPEGMHMRVLLGEHSALLPDLDALEGALQSAMADVEPA